MHMAAKKAQGAINSSYGPLHTWATDTCSNGLKACEILQGLIHNIDSAITDSTAHHAVDQLTFSAYATEVMNTLIGLRSSIETIINSSPTQEGN